MSVQQDSLIYSSYLDFTEIDHSEPTVDDYGLDSMTRTYAGMTSLLPVFLSRWNTPAGVPLNVVDWQFPGMASVGKPSINRGRGFSQVTVKFVGKISNAEPLVTIKDGWKEDMDQVQAGTDTTPNVIFGAIADYRTNTTTYEYCASSRPSVPRYSGPGASGSSVNISSVSSGADTTINTASAHGFTVAQAVIIAGTSGLTPDINGTKYVKAVTDSDTFTIDDSTTGSSGAAGTVSPASRGISIIRVRGQATVSSALYPAKLVAIIPVQRLESFTREQEGLWYRCAETWSWALTPDVNYTDDASETGFLLVRVGP